MDGLQVRSPPLLFIGRMPTLWARSVSQESKQQILQPLSVLRPRFRVSLEVKYPYNNPMLIITLRLSRSHYAILCACFLDVMQRRLSHYAGLGIHRGSLRAFNARLRSRLLLHGYCCMPLATHWRNLQGKPRVCGTSRRGWIYAPRCELARASAWFVAEILCLNRADSASTN